MVSVILLMLLFTSAQGFGMINMSNVLNSNEYYVKKSVISVISYALYHFPCIQVTIDGSMFSQLVLKKVMDEALPRSTFTFFEMDHCHGHLVVSLTDYYFSEAAIIIKPFYGYRTVFICKRLAVLDFRALASLRNPFENSDGLLTVAERSVVLKAEYPDTTMSIFKILADTTWPKKISGVENFGGMVLKVGGFNCSISAQIGPKDNLTGPPRWARGTDMKLVVEMSKRFNFRFTVVVPRGEDWGRGALEGDDSLIDMVKMAEVDMGVCGVWYTYDLQVKGVERSASVNAVSLRLLVPQTSPRGGFWYQVLLPFQIGLWIFLVVLILAVSVVLRFFALHSLSIHNKKYVSLQYSVLKVFSILVFGSIPRSESTSGPVRHLIYWWVVEAMLVTSMFSSNLVSHMTTEFYPKSVNSIQDLVKCSYRLLAPNAIDPDVYFNTTDVWQRALVNRVKEVQNRKEMAHLVSEGGKIAVLGKELHPGYILPQASNLSDWRALPFYISRYYMGMIYPKGSGLRPSAERLLLRLDEGGIIQRDMRTALDETAQRDPAVRSLALRSKTAFTPNPAALKTKCLNGPFVLLIAGIIISSLAFLAEHFTYNSSLNRHQSHIYLKFFKIKWLFIKSS